MTLTKKTWLYFSPARRQIDLLDWCHFICHKLLELSTKYSGLGVEKNGTKFRHFEGARPVCSGCANLISHRPKISLNLYSILKIIHPITSTSFCYRYGLPNKNEMSLIG